MLKQDSRLADAVNVDVNHEAATHLFNTGLLPSPSGFAPDLSPNPSSRRLTVSTSGGRNRGLPNSSPGVISPLNAGNRNRALSPGVDYSYSRPCNSPHMSSPGQLHGGAPPLSMSSEQNFEPGSFRTYNNPFTQSALAKPTAGDAYIDMTGAGGAGLVAGVPRRGGNPVAAEANNRVNPVFSYSDTSVPNSTSSAAGNYSARGLEAQIKAQQAAQHAVYDAQVRAGRSPSPTGGPGSVTPPSLSPSPPARSSFQGPTSRRGGALGEGVEPRQSSDKQKWPSMPDNILASMAENSEMGDVAGPMGMPSATGLTANLASGAVASSVLQTAGASEPIASAKLPGVPTVSRAMDPGAYNQANSMLRSQLPHFHVRASLFQSQPGRFCRMYAPVHACMHAPVPPQDILSEASSTALSVDSCVCCGCFARPRGQCFE